MGLKLDMPSGITTVPPALSDGSVKIEGVDAQVHSGRIVTEIFKMSSSPNLWTAQFMAVSLSFHEPPKSSRAVRFECARGALTRLLPLCVDVEVDPVRREPLGGRTASPP
jgi:hypothetical protein